MSEPSPDLYRTANRGSRWRRRLLGASAVAAAMVAALWLIPGCLYIVPDTPTAVQFGDGSHALVTEPRLRVLVWNIHKGGDPGFAETYEPLALRTDLFCLQEAWHGEGVPETLERAGAVEWHMATSWIERSSGVATGVATGARARVATRPLYLRSAEREPLIGTPKTAILTRYALGPAWGGGELLVANLHGVLIRGTRRLENQLAPIAETIAAHRGPVILAGDFNTWSPSRIAMLERVTSRLGLEPVFAIDPPGDADPRKSFRGHPLDHAFVRGLAASNAQVLVNDASDHMALRFEVRPLVAGERNRAPHGD